MDNFSTHKLCFFYQYFTPQIAKPYIDRMAIIHTPAHGSWLNMAERGSPVRLSSLFLQDKS